MITNAWIEENTDVDDDGYSSTTYTPKWEYQYQIGGTTYTSDRISYGAVKGYGRRKKAQEEGEAKDREMKEFFNYYMHTIKTMEQ